MSSIFSEAEALRSNSSNSNRYLEFVSPKKRCGIKAKTLFFFSGAIAVAGITVLTLGIIFLRRAPATSQKSSTISSTNIRDSNDVCDISEEMKTSDLLNLFRKIDDTYYELHPHETLRRYILGRNPSYVKNHFKPYNPEPRHLKKVSDTAKSLLLQLNSLKLDKAKLKQREIKAMAQTKHFLAHSFGNPYDYDYYAGIWMLGPNRFCYLQQISRLGYHLNAFAYKFQPKTLPDLEVLINVLKNFGRGIDEYRNNIRLGVQAGMVSSFEECIVGYHCIKQRYSRIGMFLNGKDILHEWFSWRILSRFYLFRLHPNVSSRWQVKYGQSIKISLEKTLVKHFGEPLAKLLEYLSTEHMSHCVLSNVSSGLATRPLPNVYYQGIANLSHPTTQRLPFGEKLNGSKAYERLLAYFTTTEEHTPDTVHNLGWKMLKELYPKVVQISKDFSGFLNESQAIAWFKRYINSSEMYFNREPFPANESNEKAFHMCINRAAAEMFCPMRTKAMEKWFEYTRSVLSKITPHLTNMFYFVGKRKTTPSCPVELDINFEPKHGAQTYSFAGSECSKPATYRMPFFLDRMGPVYSEVTVSAHEAQPGHHTLSQGHAEHFLDRCGPILGFLLKSRYTAFSEGWALYAENPLIAKDTTLYEKHPLDEYGMIKWQIWRALRLIVDTGLHYKGMSRAEALNLFSRYAWDSTDVAEKEVTRYQSGPGQATAYMIGQLALVKMREVARKKLGSKFKLKDFHYYVVSPGPAPLSYISAQVELYTKCTMNATNHECQGFLMAEKNYRNYRPRSFASNIYKDEHFMEEMSPPEVHEM